MSIVGDISTLLETAAWLVALVALAAPFAYASDDDPMRWLRRSRPDGCKGSPARRS